MEDSWTALRSLTGSKLFESGQPSTSAPKRRIDCTRTTEGLEVLPNSSALHRAAREIVQAQQAYLACLDKFGTGHWVSDAPIDELPTRAELRKRVQGSLG